MTTGICILMEIPSQNCWGAVKKWNESAKLCKKRQVVGNPPFQNHNNIGYNEKLLEKNETQNMASLFMPFGAAISIIFVERFDLYAPSFRWKTQRKKKLTSKACSTDSKNGQKKKKNEDKKQCMTVLFLPALFILWCKKTFYAHALV